MKKYRFSVDGKTVTVYSASAPNEVRARALAELADGELAVLMCPIQDGDFSVECFDKNSIKPREPHLCFAALSCLFDRVLSYPEMTLQILYENIMFDIDVGDEGGYSFCINPAKSKLLCTETVVFGDGIGLKAGVVKGRTICAQVLCEDSDLFASDRLTLLLAMLRECGAEAAAVTSMTDMLRIKTLGEVPYYEAISGSLIMLRDSGTHLPDGEYSALVDGYVYTFEYSLGRLVFRPDIKYLS